MNDARHRTRPERRFGRPAGMATTLRLLCGVAAGLGVASCAGSTQQVRTEQPAWTAATLYPLAEGNAWSYDVDSGDGDPVLAVSRVLTATPMAVVVTTGQGDTPYERRPDGLYKTGKGGYLLKQPIAVGARWTSGVGLSAHVSRALPEVTTPAGRFTHCAVVEEVAQTGNHVETTYCPGVGPVKVISRMAIRGQTLQVTAVLRGHAT